MFRRSFILLLSDEGLVLSGGCVDGKTYRLTGEIGVYAAPYVILVGCRMCCEWLVVILLEFLEFRLE